MAIIFRNIFLILLLTLTVVFNNVVNASNKDSSNLKAEDVKKFFSAFDKNRSSEIHRLISKGISPNVKNSSGSNIIDIVMNNNNYLIEHEEVISLLVENGLDINYAGSFGLTLLHIAAANDMFDFVELLIKYKADFNAKTGIGTGFNAIFYAKSKAMVMFLVEHKAGSYSDLDEDGNTLLHHAITNSGNIDLIEHLTSKVDVNKKSKKGGTVLTALLGETDYKGDMVETIDVLLEKGADINLPGRYGRTPFIAAFRNKNAGISILNKLIESGADINKPDSSGVLAIHYAAANNLGYLKFLISKNININAVSSKDNKTPLMLSVSYKKLDIINYLISKGANVNIKAANGKTALNIALDNDSANIVAILKKHNAVATDEYFIKKLTQEIEKKEEVEKERIRNKVTDILSAIKQNKSEKIKFYHNQLISKSNTDDFNLNKYAVKCIRYGSMDGLKYFINLGFDIKSKYKDVTALQYAIYYNNLPAVKYFVKAGLDINTKLKNGRTMFIVAASTSPEMFKYLVKSGMKTGKKGTSKAVTEALDSHKPEIAKYLMRKGYALDKKLFSKSSFLIDIIKYQNIETMKFVLDHGLNKETLLPLYGDKVTLLHFAVRIDAFKMIPFLLKAGSSPNVKTSGKVPLFVHAIEGNNLDIIKLLYEYKLNINEEDGYHKKTALYLAVESGKIEVARYLVAKGADTNKVDSYGKNSSLHLAAKRGYLDLIKRMLKTNGDVNQLNKDRKAPLDMAIEYNNKEVAQYLTLMEASSVK